MCGIFGVLAPRGRFAEALVESALTSIAHRGPDGWGLTRHDVGDTHELWLGHRRLAIVDLSDDAAQPMRRGDAVLTFNGEIYDHVELRGSIDAELTTTSDTEVLLRGLMAEGGDFLRRCNGMWALGLYDGARDTLLLSRDRLGKKPLYLYEADGVLSFASELKAFATLGLDLTLDEDALAWFRWLGYIPGRRAIYRECRKLAAATHVEIDLRDPRKKTETPFWDPLGGFERRFAGSFEDALEEVGAVIDDATRLRVRADVPVGVFLSGGIDSTLVASSISRLGHHDLQAFTVERAEKEWDETEVARSTARQLDIAITTLPISAADCDRQLERAGTQFDEPFSDPSLIPTLALSEAARRHVTVVLTGDGGDELFMGYPWVSYPTRFFDRRRWISWVPGWRRVAGGLLQAPWMEHAVRGAARVARLNTDNANVKLAILEDIVEARTPEQVYDTFHSSQPKRFLSSADRARLEGSLVEHARTWYPGYAWDAAAAQGTRALLSALDLVTYLRDGVLVKVDRATMAYGLEARSPLLDHRLVHLAQSLDTSFKVRDGVHKRLLRELVAGRIRGVSRLGKKGFGVKLPEGGEGPTPRARWSQLVERRFFQTWLPT